MAYQKQNFKNGNVLTAEQLNHMEDGIAEAAKTGGTGSADLPFGTDISYTEILPKETVTATATEGTSALQTDLTGLVHTEVGKKYRVTFDGVEYTCEAFVYDAWGAVCVGNGALIGASVGNGEPFCVNRYASYAANINVAKEGTHTVMIEEIVEEVTPIPSEYLTGEKPAPYMQLVTDGEGKAGWEERLAYTYTGKSSETYFPETTETADENGLISNLGSGYGYQVSKAIVNFDGVDYECDNWAENTNWSLYLGGDGYPFTIKLDIYQGSFYKGSVQVEEPNSTHTFAIYKIDTITVPISTKYLSDGVVTADAEWLADYVEDGQVPYFYHYEDDEGNTKIGWDVKNVGQEFVANFNLLDDTLTAGFTYNELLNAWNNGARIKATLTETIGNSDFTRDIAYKGQSSGRTYFLFEYYDGDTPTTSVLIAFNAYGATRYSVALTAM